jgi:hypothetical protein
MGRSGSTLTAANHVGVIHSAIIDELHAEASLRVIALPGVWIAINVRAAARTLTIMHPHLFENCRALSEIEAF